MRDQQILFVAGIMHYGALESHCITYGSVKGLLRIVWCVWTMNLPSVHCK